MAKKFNIQSELVNLPLDNSYINTKALPLLRGSSQWIEVSVTEFLVLYTNINRSQSTTFSIIFEMHDNNNVMDSDSRRSSCQPIVIMTLAKNHLCCYAITLTRCSDLNPHTNIEKKFAIGTF